MSKLLLVGNNQGELKNKLTQQGYEVTELSIQSADAKKIKSATADIDGIIYPVELDVITNDKFYKVKEKICANTKKPSFSISKSNDGTS